MTVRTLQQLARDSHDTLAQITNPDTLDRARARIQMTIKAFYDDEPSEPVQALGDLVADVFHEARARGLGLEAVLEHAKRIFEGEVADWDTPETRDPVTTIRAQVVPEDLASDAHAGARRLLEQESPLQQTPWISRLVTDVVDLTLTLVTPHLEATEIPRTMWRCTECGESGDFDEAAMSSPGVRLKHLHGRGPFDPLEPLEIFTPDPKENP